MDGDITSEGKRLIDDWISAVNEVKSLKSRLNSAECAEMNAQNALGKWLVPPDAVAGEKFSVWHGSSLFSADVKSTAPLDVKVTIRTRGKDFDLTYGRR